MYSGTWDVIHVLGGTNSRFTVGNAGSFSITGSRIDYFIGRADTIIDLKTEPTYGTQHFGTSSNGTRGLPQIIRDVSADLAAYYVIRSMPYNVRNELEDLGKKLKEDADNLLNSLMKGELLIPGYSLGDSNVPLSSDYSVKIYDEVVTLSGTKLTALEYAKILKYSERVHATSLDATTVYTRDTDYKIYYWEDSMGGANAGYIRRLAGGNLADGQDILIDYTYEKDRDIIDQMDHVYGVEDAPEL